MEQAQGAGRDVPQRVHAARRRRRTCRCGTTSSDALEDDFDTPRALAVTARVGLERAARPAHGGARDLRAQVARRQSTRRRRRRSWPSRRRDGRPGGRELRGGRPPARRDRRGRLADARPHRRLRPAAAKTVTADLVYGRRAVREALRGRREVLELLDDGSGARSRSRGSRRRGRQRAAGARADGARGHARPPGRGRARRAVPLRRRLRAGRGRAAAAGGARPRHRPAQPRRRLPVGRGRGGDGRRRAGARLGGRDAGGRALVRGRDRAPADRASSRTWRATSRR